MNPTDPASPGTAARFPGNTPFSYACHRCRACCHDKLIQVNPYEIARLARNRGCSTTAFIADFLERGVYLRRVENGACVFLGPEGCTVHPDRPLVCRLYPLGGHVGSDDTVTYSHIAPHPETKGVYGHDGTMADYIARQGAAPFAAAADRYLAVLQKLFDAWRSAERDAESEIGDGSGGLSGDGASADETVPPDFHDLDRAVADYCARQGIAEPHDIEERMTLHIAAITEWLERSERE